MKDFLGNIRKLSEIGVPRNSSRWCPEILFDFYQEKLILVVFIREGENIFKNVLNLYASRHFLSHLTNWR